jgi:hypothetical protein
MIQVLIYLTIDKIAKNALEKLELEQFSYLLKVTTSYLLG